METHLVECYAIKVSHFLHIFVQDLLRVHFWYQVYQFLLTQHLPSRLRLTCNRKRRVYLFIFFPHPSIALLPFSSQKQSKTYGKTYPPSCWLLAVNKRWLSYFCKRWLSSILAPTSTRWRILQLPRPLLNSLITSRPFPAWMLSSNTIAPSNRSFCQPSHGRKSWDRVANGHKF